jgi:hypothetical protein
MSHLRRRLGFSVCEVMRQWTQLRPEEFIRFELIASESWIGWPVTPSSRCLGGPGAVT